MDTFTKVVNQQQSRIDTLTKECERLDRFSKMLLGQMGKDMQSRREQYVRVDSRDIAYSSRLDNVERSTQVLEQMVLPDVTKSGDYIRWLPQTDPFLVLDLCCHKINECHLWWQSSIFLWDRDRACHNLITLNHLAIHLASIKHHAA